MKVKECMALEKYISLPIREHKPPQQAHAAKNINIRTRDGNYEKKDTSECNLSIYITTIQEHG